MWILHILFLHFFINKYLGCCYCLVTDNNVAENKSLQVSFPDLAFHSLDVAMWSFCFLLFGEPPRCFNSSFTICLCPLTGNKVPIALCPVQQHLPSGLLFKITAVLIQMKLGLSFVLICIFFSGKWYWALSCAYSETNHFFCNRNFYRQLSIISRGMGKYNHQNMVCWNTVQCLISSEEKDSSPLFNLDVSEQLVWADEVCQACPPAQRGMTCSHQSLEQEHSS